MKGRFHKSLLIITVYAYETLLAMCEGHFCLEENKTLNSDVDSLFTAGEMCKFVDIYRSK